MTRATRRRFLTISACAALVGAAAWRGQQPERLVWEGTALGADIRMVLEGPEVITRPALARARLEIDAFERRFSLFRADSDLARLNRTGALPDLDPHWRAVLAMSDRVHAATGGRFDPTIQPLWQALATGGDVARAHACVGWHRIALPSATRRGITLGQGQALSFNGIAQGAATDSVRDVLKAAGLTRVLVDIGETATIGGPWTLGAADPEHGIFAQVQLADLAMAISSPGAMQLGDTAQHILDPVGARAPHWSSVAVIARAAALADGVSTAACLMEADELRTLIASMDGITEIHAIDARGRTLRLRA